MNIYWVGNPAIRLATMPRPRGGDWLSCDLSLLKQKGVEILVSLLTPHEIDEFDLGNEESESIAAGVRFHSFPIEDMSVPDETNKFRGFLDTLEAELRSGRSTVIHCRAGIGRCSLVAACLLIRLGLEPSEALRRLSESRGCTVPETGQQRTWVLNFR